MKKIKRMPIVIIYNLTIIITFFIIYLLIRHHFENHVEPNKASIIDIISLSVTLQTTVGFSNLNPITNVAKIFVTIQQALLIFGNLIILHFIK